MIRPPHSPTGAPLNGLISFRTKVVCISLMRGRRRITDMSEVGVGVEVGRHHLQQEIGVAGDRIAGNHLTEPGDALGELLGLHLAMAVGLDADEGQHAQADLLAVERGAVAADDAGLLELPYSPPAGRGRQPTSAESA